MRRMPLLNQHDAEHDADDELTEQLLFGCQSQRALEHNFDVIVQKTDQSVSETCDEQNVKFRLAGISKAQEGNRQGEQNDGSAHRRRSCFFHMGLRSVRPDLLAELEPAQNRNRQRSGDDGQ